MAYLGKDNWEDVKRILQYLKGTVNLGLIYSEDPPIQRGVIGYVDFDYTGDLDKRRSITRYVFTLFGGVISWRAIL